MRELKVGGKVLRVPEGIKRIEPKTTKKNQGKKRTNGWQVVWRRNGQLHTCWFGDNAYGGPQQSLKKAAEYNLQRPRKISYISDDPTLVIAEERHRDSTQIYVQIAAPLAQSGSGGASFVRAYIGVPETVTPEKVIAAIDRVVQMRIARIDAYVATGRFTDPRR